MMRIRDPYAVLGEYRRAQLHCHTAESDGRFAPRELLEKYKAAGYSFVCITDHNRVTRYTALNSDEFLAIPGTEDTVTRWFRPLGPHMSRLFVQESLASGSAQDRIDRTVAEAGIASLCHLSWTGNLWTGAWSHDAVLNLRGFRLLEIWNPHSDLQKDVVSWQVALNARGPDDPVWAVAVDDCHRQENFDRGWIMVKVPVVSAEQLRKALANGSFYASTGLDLECSATDGQVWVRLKEPAMIQMIDSSGTARISVHGTEATYGVRGDEGYVRIECSSAKRKAWSQPFWITRDS